MSLKSIVRDGMGSISRRGFSDPRRKERERGRSAAAAAASSSTSFPNLELVAGGDQGSWAGLPPELLREVVGRVEQSESAWPARRHLVASASVCRSWRRVCKDIVGAPEVSGKLTFPVSLKQPGPRNGAIQCYIKRNKATSTYQLFLGLNPENGKFLLSARKIRCATHAEYVISMASEDISRNSVSYVGKLRSNFLGTKFAIYDSQPPYGGAVTSGRSSRRFYSRKVSPKVPSGSYGIAHIAYELNMLGTRGPRRMRCTMHSIPASSLEPTGFVPFYYDTTHSLEDSFSSMSLSRPLDRLISDTRSTDSTRFTGTSSRFTGSTSFADSSRFTESTRFTEVSIDLLGKGVPLILKNKAPRWHEQLQCWCLNFRGRVTVASVKNFQLIAASAEPANKNNTVAGTTQPGSSDHDKIILQFGKIGRDLFTMDYRYPLSAFQAFGICLSSFDTKLACE